MISKLIIFSTICCLWIIPQDLYAGLNKDGLAVLRLAADEYHQIINNTAVVSDKGLNTYVLGVARKLMPQDMGINLNVTLLNKAMPEVYSMANGTIMLSTGALFAVTNESQLAALLSHEVAHIVGNHYPGIYQTFKARERKGIGMDFLAGMAGIVLDTAIDYGVGVETDKLSHGMMTGDVGYREAMRKIRGMEAATGVVVGFKDVYQSLPEQTRAGSGDPRIPFEMVADAEGLKLLVMAGYDPRQAGDAWRQLRKVMEKEKRSDPETQVLAMLPPMMRKMVSGVEGPMGDIRAEALTRTLDSNPPDRPAFLDSLAKSEEIVALTGGKSLNVGEKSFRDAVGHYMLLDSRKARDEGDWTRARQYYQTAWDSGFKTVEVATGLGEAQLDGFAFAATEHEKERAEYYMLEGIKLDKRSPVPYKALGELYGEWDRYEEAVKMYGKYLQLSPKAGDRKRIERQIQKFNRKARR